VCSSDLELKMFFGSKTWWRSKILLGYGKKINKVFLQGSSSFLFGNSLNTVNQFLIGGSWDIQGTNTLYGHHYAEFRLDRCLLLNAGIDIKLLGNLEFGVRTGYLNSPLKTTYGEAFKLMTVLNGIAINTGIGFPDNSLFMGEFNKMITFAGFTAALF